MKEVKNTGRKGRRDLSGGGGQEGCGGGEQGTTKGKLLTVGASSRGGRRGVPFQGVSET